MKKILLVYAPFCTPASPPYSITNLYSMLKSNTKDEVYAINLNARFHNIRFPEAKKYYQKMDENYDKDEYDSITKDFVKESAKVYSENNKKVVEGKDPELIDEMVKEITGKKPDLVGFSVVYSSQAFYTYALIKKLKQKGIKTIVGGPAVNNKLEKEADLRLDNEKELLKHITGKDDTKEHTPDFSIYPEKDYFVPKLVIPIKTSTTCYYKKCTFCTHYSKEQYYEYELKKIKETIIKSGQKNFFLIDDMIHKKRLLEIGNMMNELNVRWTCQLRPTSEFDYETLKTLKESGMDMAMWGVESGNDRILKLINKGTNKEDISKVLSGSHKAGIKNVVYIIFGFPTETKEEFLDTISFLKENAENIDLISTSIFGLQKGTKIYENPAEFGITDIKEEKRTVLEPRITYKIKEGLSNEQAKKLRQKYKKTIEKINKFPKRMNYFREHMMIIC